MKKITQLLSKQCSTYSVEITPDITEEEINKLDLKPAFFAVTWHAKIHKCKGLDIAPVKLAKYLSDKGHNVLLHLSCDFLRKHYLKEVLFELKTHNICNLLVVLGESYDSNESDFKNVCELVHEIRKSTDDYFCIGVAGFPDASQERIQHLKLKIDVGANFILTQAFFDVKVFRNYVQSCNEIGINVPVIPGLYLFENYTQLNSFASKCKVKVSNQIVDQIKTEGESKLNGQNIMKGLIAEIKDKGLASHIHFYTLNKFDRVKKVVTQTNL